MTKKLGRVFGIGIRDIPTNSYDIKVYRVWQEILDACRHGKADICNEWRVFSRFNSWYAENYREGTVISSRVLVEGNRRFAPELCCFVPVEITRLLKGQKRRAETSNLPRCVAQTPNGRYAATVWDNSENNNIGTFDEIHEAVDAAIAYKRKVVSEIATKAYSEGIITEQVFKALLKLEFMSMYAVGDNPLPGRYHHGVTALERAKPYHAWVSMMSRCYDENYHRKRPTYRGCSVCEEWQTFENFEQWYYSHHRDGFQLDKDILVEGNKVYSPATCVYVPNYVNMVVQDRKRPKKHSDLPVGVTRTPSGKFAISTNRPVAKKSYETVEKAREAYLTWKRECVHEVAERALAAGDIDERVYQALINRKCTGE